MNMRPARYWVALSACFLLSACGGGGGGTPQQPPPPPQNQSISFTTPGPVTGPVGTTVTNVASGGPGTGAVGYESSNTSIASVNATTGVATLGAVGTAIITATKAASTGFNSATASYTLNVTQGAQSIGFAQPGPLNLVLDASQDNPASGGAGSGAITYASSNPSAVQVNATGRITALGVGTSIITATKAADANYTQAQASYTAHAQTADKVSAWIGASDSQVNLPISSNGLTFGRARMADCEATDIGASCNLAHVTPGLTGAVVSDSRATLTNSAYYALLNGATLGTPVDVNASRFSNRIGHAVVRFQNRYWVLGGGERRATTTQQFEQRADVWSSSDGKSWKLETAAAGFGPRWFHHAVVFNNEIWVISGSNPTSAVSDVWSSPDGINWLQRQAVSGLPWLSTHLNVVVFNNEIWAVSGGAAYSSTNGLFTRRSAIGAIGPVIGASTPGRAYASLIVYNNALWYIGGAPDFAPTATPPRGTALNDVWRSPDGVTWTQVTAAASFSPRFRHESFELNGRLWILGGNPVTNGVVGPASGNVWSTTDGVSWRTENVGSPGSFTLVKAVVETSPARVSLIGGSQRGYSNHVLQTTNGFQWTEQSAYAQFNSRAAETIEFNGYLWAIGGSTIADDDASPADTNEIWRSADGLNWTKITPTGASFTPRDGHRLAVFNGRLWLVGGWDNLVAVGGTETRLNDVWSTPDGAAWTFHGNAPFGPRTGHTLTQFAGRLWVIGGSTASGAVADIWSSADGVSWEMIVAAAPFSARYSHETVVLGDAMYIVAGGTDLGLADVWRSTNGVAWTRIATDAFPARTRHSTTVFNGRIYVVGGVSSEAYEAGVRYGDVWSSADGSVWRQDVAVTPFAARSLAGLIVRNNELYVIGGMGWSFFNDVWRSSDGVNWRVGFSHSIAPP